MRDDITLVRASTWAPLLSSALMTFTCPAMAAACRDDWPIYTGRPNHFKQTVFSSIGNVHVTRN